MAKGTRYWLVTVCITLLRVRNGYTKTDKIVEGTLNTSENWAFITSFLFNKSAPAQLKYHFEYPLSYSTQNVILYFDEQWPGVYPQAGMDCIDRENGVYRGINQIINLTTSYIWSGCHEKEVQTATFLICNGHRRFRSDRDRWWYIALSNCNSPKGLVMKYRLEITNEKDAPDQSTSLKCHHCTSTKSWEDCEQVFNQSTAECTQEDSVCFSVHYRKGGSTQYERSCGLKSYCEKEANPVCSDEGGSSECDIRCCDDDMCNAGSVISVSALLITVGVFALIFMVEP